MSVRQYVGARYVPKFFENPNGSAEWIKNTTYEPLTIVTYLGNSYTSKKPVPLNTEITNTEYWVLSSNFSEQVNELIEKTESSIKIVNTFNDMIELNSLVAGNSVRTLGYYTVGDGGEANYTILNSQPNSGLFFKLNNGNYALFNGNSVNVKQLGAYSNNTGADKTYSAIQTAIDSGLPVYIPKGEYNIGDNTIDCTKFPQFHNYNLTMDIDTILNYSGDNCAINILSFGASVFTLGTIKAPNGCCIKSVSTRYTNGGGYLTIYGGNLVAGSDAFLVGAVAQTAYSNEICFYNTTLNGRVNGFHAINTIKGLTDNTYIGHYKLNNVSFEGMTNGVCVNLEDTSENAAIEDVFLYGLRTTEALMSGCKLIKSTGRVLRVTGVLSDPIFTNNSELAPYFDIGEKCQDWSILLTNEFIFTVNKNGSFRVTKLNTTRTQKNINLPAEQNYTLTLSSEDCTVYLLTVLGATNSSWYYCGIIFLSANYPKVCDISKQNIEVTLNNKNNLTIKNINTENGIIVTASLVPLNYLHNSSLLEDD